MIQEQPKQGFQRRSVSIKHSQSMSKPQNILIRIALGEFSEAWNKQIACGTRCEFYQYRLQYIDYLKTLFIKKFQDLINKSFIDKSKEKQGYTLKYNRKQNEGIDSKLVLEIEIIGDNSQFKLSGHSSRIIFDRIGKSRDCCLLIINVDSVNQTPQQQALFFSFTKKLQQLLLYFVVQSYRIQPNLLKQLDQSVLSLQNFSYEQLQRIKQTQLTRFQLNLIDQSKSTQQFLRKMIQQPHFCKQFDMVKVQNKQGTRIKYVYKQSIKMPKGKDYLTFHDRNFSYEGFRKHISFLFPFWFTLQLMFQNINQKTHCQVVLIPPLFSMITKQKLAEKIKTYIINLSEATNTKVLLNLLQKKHFYSSTPYQLFINNKLRKNGTLLKNNPSEKQTVFKTAFLNVSAYPLYQRFAHGNGLQNIKKSQLWKPHAVQNLEDTYVIRFKQEIFIINFHQDMPFKDKRNLTQQMRMRKVLIYQVYGLYSKISKQEYDFEFRAKIRQAQLQPLLTKISQRLVEAPEFLNWSQLSFLQAGKKHSFKLTLPYMSCYGIYLSYLKQKLNYIHRKTSKKKSHQNTYRKFSHGQTTTLKQIDTIRFCSFISQNDLDEYQYSYNQNEDMLFLFNYAAPRGNSQQPFGKCIYLLNINLLQDKQKLQQISSYISKELITNNNSKKKSYYVYGRDPTQQSCSNFDKQVKQLIDNLNEIFPDKDNTTFNRDSDAISSNSNQNNFYDVNQYDNIRIQRKYENLELEFNFQIIGNQDIKKIEQYCQTQIQSTYCDYLIESILFRLKQNVEDYVRDLPLMSKKKNKLAYDDIKWIVFDSLPHLLKLDKMACMKKSLTIFNYKSPKLEIHQYLHMFTLMMKLAENFILIITNFTSIVVKKVDMIYYVLNSHKKITSYGSYSKLLTKVGNQYNSFIKALSQQDTQVGIIFGSHFSQIFEKIQEDNKKSSWIHSVKQYPDGKFFNSQTFVFKRSFLLKLSINKEGIKYFSYNVNRNINYSIIKNIETTVVWNREKKYLLEALKKLKQGGKVQVPKRQQFGSSLSLFEAWDPYHQIHHQKTADIKKSIKHPSLTQLFKSLVFEIVPPIDKTQYVNVFTSEFNRIYQILFNQKVVDFEKYGDLPKSKLIEYKCQLSRLGFQVLSILRYTVIKQIRRKQEDQDN